jgi:hypothetical protein
MTSEFVIRDALYGRIALPAWLRPALSLPEFARLRGVRQSNLDSIEFKDFSSPSRWSHGIGAAYLATITAAEMRLDERRAAELILAALLHDVATPPFGHTAEHAIGGFDHELESVRLLLGADSAVTDPGFPVFESQLGQFRPLCRRLARLLAMPLSAEAVAEMIVGSGDLGYLIAGTIDLDNADNVTRALHYLGDEVDRALPIRVAKWLAHQQHRPLQLRDVDNPDIQMWLEYRDRLYANFFFASKEEIGRQAFLEHLMRRSLAEGLPVRTLVWCTDDELLLRMAAVEGRRANGKRRSLAELVSNYRLLRTPRLLATVPVPTEMVDLIANPAALRWIEEELGGGLNDVMVTLQKPRFTLTPAVAQSVGHLYSTAAPTLYVFTLSSGQADEHRGNASMRTRADGGQIVARDVAALFGRCRKETPWMSAKASSRRSLPLALESVGDWSFRLSRNESFHPYPSTFVHALPSTLLRALELQGATVLDPFCGTGETVLAALRISAKAVASDANRIALLVAKARVTYLTAAERLLINAVTVEMLNRQKMAPAPALDLRRWHHPATQIEIRKILHLCLTEQRPGLHRFFLAALSATLPLTTARRGKQNSYFADNTPLPAGVSEPPYVSACELFVARVRRNLSLLEKLYADLERKGRDAREDLNGVCFRQADARKITASDFALKPRTVDAIVTSPPYLCAVDYTLGSRLSYYWLCPEGMTDDFAAEMGARRRRSSSADVLADYMADLHSFAEAVVRIVRPGGLLAVVLGEPRAKAFMDAQIIEHVDQDWAGIGLRLLWKKWRPVQWHRNHGYANIMNERVALYEVE